MEPFRAEVVGSLLRPHYLSEARTAFEAGRLPAEGLRRLEDRAVDQAIALQEATGVDVVSDGEMRRFTFFDQLVSAVEGLSEAPSKPVPFHSDSGETIDFQSPISVTGKLRRKEMITPPEFAYARARARLPVKATLPSPLMTYALYSAEHTGEAYPDPFDMFRDAADLIREEVRVLVGQGCTYVQIDAPDLCELVDEGMWAHWSSLGVEPERVLTEGIDLINSVVDDVPAGVYRALHLCRGNYQSKWIAQGGYDELARALFPRATNFDAFLLEYDDARSGSFEALAGLADDKVAVLGLVCSKKTALEAPEDLIARIDEAARYHPKERLALSTQCGFASVAMGNDISERTQEDKLRLVAETARRVWG